MPFAAPRTSTVKSARASWCTARHADASADLDHRQNLLRMTFSTRHSYPNDSARLWQLTTSFLEQTMPPT
eukprot:9476532-Pyramimonas_sp.AAC.1